MIVFIFIRRPRTARPIKTIKLRTLTSFIYLLFDRLRVKSFIWRTQMWHNRTLLFETSFFYPKLWIYTIHFVSTNFHKSWNILRFAFFLPILKYFHMRKLSDYSICGWYWYWESDSGSWGNWLNISFLVWGFLISEAWFFSLRSISLASMWCFEFSVIIREFLNANEIGNLEVTIFENRINKFWSPRIQVESLFLWGFILRLESLFLFFQFLHEHHFIFILPSSNKFLSIKNYWTPQLSDIFYISHK